MFKKIYQLFKKYSIENEKAGVHVSLDKFKFILRTEMNIKFPKHILKQYIEILDPQQTNQISFNLFILWFHTLFYAHYTHANEFSSKAKHNTLRDDVHAKYYNICLQHRYEDTKLVKVNKLRLICQQIGLTEQSIQCKHLDTMINIFKYQRRRFIHIDDIISWLEQ